ncbi:MAG TPA: thioredoxin family protein [Ktedonobacterales bacterium]|nr:thioredoxin family protein [Ktedonobacterales bacterium]
MRLDIYIANHCENCQEALRLAELARTVQGAEVRVINLDTATEPVPARIIATPMYLLDDRIVSMGNPYPDDLLRLLSQTQQIRESASG